MRDACRLSGSGLWRLGVWSPGPFALLLWWLVVAAGVCGEGVYELRPYEVNGWRFDAPALDLAADVTHVEGEALEATNASGVAELLRKTANLGYRSFNGKSGAGELSLRGFGVNSGLRVLVLVDGMKVNPPDMGGIEWQALPLAEIESIEVIRGGQNVLYGNHAVSGVVRIHTRRGGASRIRGMGRLGSYGAEGLDLSASGESGRLYYRGGVHHERDRGYRDHSLSWSRSVQGAVGYRFSEGDEVRVRLSFGESHLQFPGPLTYDQFREESRASHNSGTERSESENGQFTARWQGLREWGQIDVNAGLSSRERDINLDGTFALNRLWSLSLNPRFKIGGEERFLVIGGNLLADRVAFDDFLDPGHSIRQARSDIERLTAGSYLYGQVKMAPALSLNAGIRYERAETEFLHKQFDPDQINPLDPVIWDPQRPNPDYKDPPDILPEASYDDGLSKDGIAAEVSVSRSLGSGITAWIGYDRVYRYPSLDEVAAYQGFALAEPLNRDLEPEAGDNLEAGLRWRPGSWTLSATAFQLRMEDEIAFDDRLDLNVNLDGTRRRGLEAAAGYETRTAGVQARISWIRAQFASGPHEGKAVPLVPGFQGVITGWIQPVPGLRLSADCVYVSSRFQGNDDANELRELDAHALVGLQAGWRMSERARLALRVDNLFDKEHISTAYRGGFYPGSGRRFEAVLNLTFD